MASGHAHGGADGAKAALEDFWKRVSDTSRFSPMRRGPMEMLTGQWTLDYSPMYLAAEMASRIFSPYDLNPLGNNPLSPILADMVDFEALAGSPIKLFITATNVRTGAGHVFRNAQITPDVLLASGCLPTMFQAVEIDGEFYWDGGYSGNPTITPLVRECDSHDTILVQINPIVRDEIPRSARDIMNRLNEVSFNAPLLKELRMIALLHKVADPGRGEGAQWAGMRLHRIATERVTELNSSSKLITEWRFLCGLRDEGRRTASQFLEAHAADLGTRSTVDLDALLTAL
jgi:NTE family protein